MSVNSNLTASQQNVKELPKSKNLTFIPGSLTPVISFYFFFKIFARIFVKIRDGPYGKLSGPGETDLEKT